MLKYECYVSGVLIIRNVTSADEGLYMCELKYQDSFGLDYDAAFLRIDGILPHITS